MASIIEYFNERLISMLFVFAQNIINHTLILNIQFVLMDIKVSKRKILLCASFISLFYLVPFYTVSIFDNPNTDIVAWLYNLLIFISPPVAFLDYFVIKHIFRFSPLRTSIVLRNHWLFHFIIVLLYMIFNNAFVTMYGTISISNGFYLGDLVSILFIIILLLANYFVLKTILKKSRRYIIIPPAYVDKNINKSILSIFLASSIIYCIVVFFRSQWITNIRNPLTETTAFFYLLLILCILLYLLNTISQLRIKLNEWEMQTTGTYISSLLHANQEFQRIKHDFFNILQVYGGFFEIEDYEGVKKYHRSLFNTTKQAADFISIIGVLRSRIAVYSLLNSMSEKAKKLGVEFSINQVCDITNIILTDLDLCRILAIVIDNALEEAELSINKQVNISFERKYENTIVFIVSNTTKNDIDVKHIFDNGYTTKANHTGIGLTMVTEILNSYEQCHFRINYHDNQFTMFLILAAFTNK